MPDLHRLPDDKDALRAMVAALQAQSEVLQSQREALQSENTSYEKALQIERAKNEALDRHIATLEQQLAALRRARYGRRSEQLDQHIYQLELMLEDLGASVSERREPDALLPGPDNDHNDDQKKPPAKKRQPLPEHLPRDIVVHEVDPVCAQCGETVEPFSRDASEQLEYVPASFRVIKHVRPKCRCGCDDKIHQAEAPSRPGMPARGYWPMWPSLNTLIICHCTANRRSTLVKAWS